MSDTTGSQRPPDGTVVLPLAGELDIAVAEALRAQAAAALERPETRTLIFDMTAVTFIDASAITAFIAIRDWVPVEMTNVSVRILRVLTLAGVAEYFGGVRPHS